MTAPSSVPEQIEEMAMTLKAKGCSIIDVELGDNELEDFYEWCDSHYCMSVLNAIQSHTPFYWHGYKIRPAGTKSGFIVHI